MRCYRKIICISYKDHVTKEEVHNSIQQAIGPYEDLLTTVKRRKMKWYGHEHRTRQRPSCKAPLGSKKTRKTEEEVGGQHQRVDRPGLLTKGGRRQEEVDTAGNCTLVHSNSLEYCI